MDVSELKNLKWDLVPREFVIVDVETTGLDSDKDRILEIGAVHFEKSDYLKTGEVNSFQVFIKQDKPIPSDATAINNITDEMVAEGDYEYVALQKFIDFIGDKQLFAYNAKFDRGFLRNALERNNVNHNRHAFTIQDIYAQAKKYIHGLPNRKLETIATKTGWRGGVAHRAVNDCAMALHVFIYIKNLEYSIKLEAAKEANLTLKEFEKYTELSNKHLDYQESSSVAVQSAPKLASDYDYPSTHTDTLAFPQISRQIMMSTLKWRKQMQAVLL